MRELALVQEAGPRGNLGQGQIRPCLQELLGPLDAAGDDVLVRRRPGGRLELAGEVGLPQPSLASDNACFASTHRTSPGVKQAR